MKRLPRVTRRDSVEIRGVYGQPIFEFFQQAQAILERGAMHDRLSRLFAEPQIHPGRGEIVWYTKAQGAVREFSSLDPDECSALLRAVQELRQQVEALAETFSSEAGSAAGTRAEILRTMLASTDSLDCLYLVGEQPVLCEWGCKRLVAGSDADALWTYGGTLRTKVCEEGANQEDSGDVESIPVAATPPPAESTQPEVNVETAEAPLAAPEPEVTPASEAPPVTSARIEPEPVRFTPSSRGAANPHSVSEMVSDDQRPPSLGRPPRPATSLKSIQMFWGSGIWSFIKALIVLTLLLLFLLTLLRACNSPTATPLLSIVPDIAEEASLRRDIAALHVQADRVLANCPAH